MKRAVLLAALALAVSSCDVLQGTRGTLTIASVDDEPIVYPMTVDPSDHNVPPEYSQAAWNGAPFSWQCYDPELAASLGRDLGSRPVPPLEIVVDVGENDGLLVSYEARVDDASIQERSLCIGDPAFVPQERSGGGLLGHFDYCRGGLTIDGVPVPNELGPITGLSPGEHTIRYEALACAGQQQGIGDQALTVEVIEAQFAGTVPHTPITTVGPLTYPTVAPTTTTEPPATFDCPLDGGEQVTRKDMAMVLWRLNGELTPVSPHPFVDVANSVYNDPIAWVVEAGITTGTSPTTFSPESWVTPAQQAVFLYREAGSPAVVGSPAHPFTDVDGSAFYADAVQWLFESDPAADWSNGNAVSEFGPDDILVHDRVAGWFNDLGRSFDYYACPGRI